MSSYVGRHAELYDIFYADKPYAEEAAFVHECLRQYSVGTTHRLLELACGTGSHVLELEKHGYQIVGTDYSKDMVARARRKATETNSSIAFRHQDMRALDVAEGPFDTVICLFDSIGYVQTNEALSQVFRSVHRHLRPDGLFLFEFWHAAAMLRHYDPVRVRRWSTPEGEIVRISETVLKPAEQLAEVTYTIYELHHDGTYSSLKETHTNRYFLVQEMAGWLGSFDFAPLKWFAGFAPDEDITEETWHVVALARRSAETREAERE